MVFKYLQTILCPTERIQHLGIIAKKRMSAQGGRLCLANEIILRNQQAISTTKYESTWSEVARTFMGMPLASASSLGLSKANRVSFRGFSKDGLLAARGPK